jgi:hypothetical protein
MVESFIGLFRFLFLILVESYFSKKEQKRNITLQDFGQIHVAHTLVPEKVWKMLSIVDLRKRWVLIVN